MENKKYHKIRTSRAKSEFCVYLKEKWIWQLPIFIIGTGANYNFNHINWRALLYEFVGVLIMFGVMFLWKSLKLVPENIYKEQQDIIISKQKTIESLEEKQKAKLIIEFDETSSDYRREISQKSTNPNTAYIYDRFELTWCISIYNESPIVKIKGVKAKLTIVGTDSKKATQLKFTDYNDKPYLRSIDISPKDREFVDVINWFMVHGKEKEDLRCDICNIELDHNYTRIPVSFYVGEDDCKIKIEVFADNAPPVSRYFIIGVRNDDNTINKIYMEKVQEIANC